MSTIWDKQLTKGIPMDIQVRDCCYETNSSSSHSLSISADNIFDMNFSQHALRSGVIKLVVPVDEDGEAVHFENEWRRFYTPENILLYMLISAVDGKITARVPDVDILPTLSYNYKRARDLADAPRSRDRKRLRDLLDWVKGETGCRVELSFPSHPEAYPTPNPRSICIGSDQAKTAQRLIKDHGALKSLIFNGSSYVETGYDNEMAPYFIPTDDRGIETYFADRMADRTDLETWFTLTVSEGKSLSYEDKDGEIQRGGNRGYDLYDLIRIDGAVDFHLVACDIVLPVYVSALPEGMEELDYDLRIENRDRLLDLMNAFVSYAVTANARKGDASRVTMQPGFVPGLVEDGTSTRVPRMPHDCKEFKVRIACDEATRLKVRAKSASVLMDEAA
jgi:hypothetical protein